MPPSRSVAAAAVALLMLLAFTAFRPAGTRGPIERDFEAYYAAGASVNAGRDPYSRAIWNAERQVPGVEASRDELLPYVGPAAALPLWSLLARLPYLFAAAIWAAVLAGALLTIVVLALRLTGAQRDPWRYGLALAFATAAAPAIGALALGQTALVAAGAVAAAMATYAGRRPSPAFAATLIAALQPNVTLALLARMRSRWDVAVAACAAAAFAGLGCAAGGGPLGALAYIRDLAAHARAERDIAIQHTPAAIAYACGLSSTAADATGWTIAAAALGVTGFAIVRERLDATTATLLACAALPLIVPFFHEQDFAIALFPLLVLALRSSGAPRTLAAVAAVLILIDWFGLAQRHGAQGQILGLGLVVAIAFGGLRRSGPVSRADGAAIVAVGLFALLAVPLALAHPAPTWPDGLPAHYAAPPGAAVGAVWGAEQRAAGLNRRDVAWGVLRAFPLGGCVLLGCALVGDARQRRCGLPESGTRTSARTRVALGMSDRARQMSTPSMSSNGVVAFGCQPVRSVLNE